eukprot:COSAG04_NODE_5979_length_1441_cov_1.666170_1_plen_186_part_00
MRSRRLHQILDLDSRNAGARAERPTVERGGGVGVGGAGGAGFRQGCAGRHRMGAPAIDLSAASSWLDSILFCQACGRLNPLMRVAVVHSRLGTGAGLSRGGVQGRRRSLRPQQEARPASRHRRRTQAHPQRFLAIHRPDSGAACACAEGGAAYAWQRAVGGVGAVWCAGGWWGRLQAGVRDWWLG